MSGSVTSVFEGLDYRHRYGCAGEVSSGLRPTEPAYLFCEHRLQNRASRFLQGFPGVTSYAVKANPEPRVLRSLAGSGIENFDVASLAEVRAVLTHCPTAFLHFNNPVKAIEAIEQAYQRHGVRSFALDEMSELRKIQRATGSDTCVLYTVRFKLAHDGAAYDFGSKFGATPEQAATLMHAIHSAGARVALTFHPGSQCTDPRMYARYIEAAASIAETAGVQPELVNVGGGFPEHYLDTDLPLLEDYFEVIREAAVEHLGGSVPLMCEPGRGMVASAVSLMSRVIHVRDCGRSVFLNDGVYGGMQEQSLVDLRFPARVWRDGQAFEGAEAQYQVFGPTCDPIDRMSRPVTLPEGLKTGDYIEFGLLGAYGSATSTNFNGFASGTYIDVSRGTDFKNH